MSAPDHHDREHDRLERDSVRSAEAHVREHAAHERVHIAEHTEVEKAWRRIDSQLHDMNGFREQLAEQAATHMTREMYEERHSTLEHRIDLVERAQEATLARAYGLTATGKLILGMATLVATIAAIVSFVVVWTH